jgi:hypothetical protein
VLFKKLFQMLVVSGAVVSASAGCAVGAEGKPADGKAARNGGVEMAKGDGGTPDAGADKTEASGGGVQGW